MGRDNIDEVHENIMLVHICFGIKHFFFCVDGEICSVVYTLRNYFCIDADPLHPMSFWHFLD